MAVGQKYKERDWADRKVQWLASLSFLGRGAASAERLVLWENLVLEVEDQIRNWTSDQVRLAVVERLDRPAAQSRTGQVE